MSIISTAGVEVLDRRAADLADTTDLEKLLFATADALLVRGRAGRGMAVMAATALIRRAAVV
ncbi:MAG: hypothetical protein R3D52_09425 [Xanthobacteraceae bacterium]